jgi:hypothetical protein
LMLFLSNLFLFQPLTLFWFNTTLWSNLMSFSCSNDVPPPTPFWSFSRIVPIHMQSSNSSTFPSFALTSFLFQHHSCSWLILPIFIFILCRSKNLGATWFKFLLVQPT